MTQLGAGAALCACGVSAASTAQRCRACPAFAAFAPTVGTGHAAPGMPPPGMPTPGRFVPEQRAPQRVVESRWKKGQTTFGPVGRIVATILLLIPVPVLMLTIAIGVGIAGMVAYCGVVLPMALRQVWQKTRFVVP